MPWVLYVFSSREVLNIEGIQVHPVTAVEIEISPFSYEENQQKVIATATELGISVLAYSWVLVL
jgi:hypothetical protein